MSSWDGKTERRSMNPEYQEIMKRLGDIDINIAVAATESKNSHKAFRDFESKIEERNKRVDDTIYGPSGLVSRFNQIDIIKSSQDSHASWDKWLFGTLITIVMFILGKVIGAY